MMTVLKILVLLVIVAAVVFAFGPRPDDTIRVSFSPEAMGEDIDAYLVASEEVIPDITSGAEKEIIWQNPNTKSRTPYSVVYLHGFSSTKEEIRPVPDLVANDLKANLYFTRLAGHGRGSEAFATASMSDWADDTSEAIEIGKRIGEKTIIIATSTGATLATWAAAQEELASKIDAMIFVSPNFATKGMSTRMGNMPWAETIIPLLAGKHRSWEPATEEQGKWWTTSYPTKALFPMMALLKRVEAIDKGKIKIPTLFVYSPEDMVIEPSYVVDVESKWGGKSKAIAVDSKSRARHVIAGDILDPGNNQLFQNMILDWVSELKL